MAARLTVPARELAQGDRLLEAAGIDGAYLPMNVQGAVLDKARRNRTLVNVFGEDRVVVLAPDAECCVEREDA